MLTSTMPFCSPIIKAALNITEEQEQKIAALLEDARESLFAEMTTRTEAYQQQQNPRNEVFAQVIRSHNEKFHAQVVALLSDSQMQRLEKERLKGIGLWALKKKEVRIALALTKEQSKSIDEILARQPIRIELKPLASEGDFQKRAEEFHKGAKENHKLFMEHSRKQNEDIQNVLSESQQLKFIDMTGHRFNTNPSI